MTEISQPPSGPFIDQVIAAVRAALAAVDRHEASLGSPRDSGEDEPAWATTVGRFEDHLAGWQAVLGEMAEAVRVAHDDLAALDSDLKAALDGFAAARKYLQGG